MDNKKDIRRIAAICRSKGYHIPNEVAENLWLMFSDSYCAVWLDLYEDDEDVYHAIKPYMNEYY